MAATGSTTTGAQFWARTGELALVVTVALGAVWFMFVPVRLEFDRVELTIRYFFGRTRTIPWCELELYGSGNNVFMLQFESGHTFQIFPAAFSEQDLWELTNFLSMRCPECKAD